MLQRLDIHSKKIESRFDGVDLLEVIQWPSGPHNPDHMMRTTCAYTYMDCDFDIANSYYVLRIRRDHASRDSLPIGSTYVGPSSWE